MSIRQLIKLLGSVPYLRIYDGRVVSGKIEIPEEVLSIRDSLRRILKEWSLLSSETDWRVIKEAADGPGLEAVKYVERGLEVPREVLDRLFVGMCKYWEEKQPRRILVPDSLTVSVGIEGGVSCLDHIVEKSLGEEGLDRLHGEAAVAVNALYETELPGSTAALLFVGLPDVPMNLLNGQQMPSFLVSRYLSGHKKMRQAPYSVVEQTMFTAMQMGTFPIRETVNQALGYDPYNSAEKMTEKIASKINVVCGGLSHIYGAQTAQQMGQMREAYADHSTEPMTDRWLRNNLWVPDGGIPIVNKSGELYVQDPRKRVIFVDHLKTLRSLWLPNYDQVQIAVHWTVYKMVELESALREAGFARSKTRIVREYLSREDILGEVIAEEILTEIDNSRDKHDVGVIGSRIVNRFKERGRAYLENLRLSLATAGRADRAAKVAEIQSNQEFLWQFGFSWFTDRRQLYLEGKNPNEDVADFQAHGRQYPALTMHEDLSELGVLGRLKQRDSERYLERVRR